MNKKRKYIRDSNSKLLRLTNSSIDIRLLFKGRKLSFLGSGIRMNKTAD